MEDYEQVVELQKKCFPGMGPWGLEQFKSHLEIFQEGQICVEYNKKVVASSNSLIIDYDIYKERHSWHEVSDNGYIRNHDPEGDTLYGIEIMVDPEFRGMKLARRLYEARKQLCREKNLMRILIGGRIPNYNKYKKKMSAREYVEKVMDKTLSDPVLTMQLSNGFVLKRIIRDYLETDTESEGYATLMEWTNIDYHPLPHKRYLTSRPIRVCAVQYQMRSIPDFKAFAQQCEYFIDVASDYKCDFILFPELFTNQMLSFIEAKRPGMAVRKLADYTQQYLELMSDFSIKYNINIIGGSHLTLENEQLYNISYLFQRNGQVEKQYKLHITPNERRWWGVIPGKDIRVFTTDRGRISIQICYDIEFPEVSRIAVGKGAEIVFVPFCTDERHAYLRVRYCAQSRCIENEVFVVIAGTVGNLPFAENMDIQYAQSGIFTPSDFVFSRDAIAAECTPNVETIVIHDLDLDLLRRQRMSGTTLNWQDRRKDLYEVISKG
jgi:predicted amidohydrolase/GNAT superfamily N-acetyltransferase